MPSSAIFYFCPGNTDARLIFFNHGRAASRAVYRGFLTREIHRSRSLFLLARCARASERVSVRVSPDSPLYTTHDTADLGYHSPSLSSSHGVSTRTRFFPRFFTPGKQYAYDCFREIKNKAGPSVGSGVDVRIFIPRYEGSTLRRFFLSRSEHAALMVGLYPAA